MSILASVLFVGGLLVGLAGTIWFWARAFEQSVLWGVIGLLLPIGPVIVLVKYPYAVGKALLVVVLSSLPLRLGLAMNGWRLG